MAFLVLAGILGSRTGPPWMPTASAQETGTREGNGIRQSGAGSVFEDQVAVSWVLVPVVVRSKKGLEGELERGDFELRVDGETVPIETFDAERSAPTSLVWLQDLSGSMANGGKLEASRRAFHFFLERLRPRDEMAVATFAGSLLQVEVPFTDEPSALEESAELWRGWGTTTLHDAVAFLPEISTESRHHKRAVILITDGVDNASVLSPVEARLLIREARLPVYVLGFTTADPRERVREEESFRYAQLLERLARASGGRFLRVEDPRDVEAAAAAVLDELRNQYVLGFPALLEPRRWRPLEVELTRPGRRAGKWRLLYREGYSGGPPEAP